MWYLIQGAIILLFVAYFHDKTPNRMVPGVLGGAAAYAVTVVLFYLRQFVHRPRDRRLRKNF